MHKASRPHDVHGALHMENYVGALLGHGGRQLGGFAYALYSSNERDGEWRMEEVAGKLASPESQTRIQ